MDLWIDDNNELSINDNALSINNDELSINDDELSINDDELSINNDALSIVGAMRSCTSCCRRWKSNSAGLERAGHGTTRQILVLRSFIKTGVGPNLL
eukprot:COSAG06_NODE_977_length_11246_cov_599.741724_6_plen_97_part_00